MSFQHTFNILPQHIILNAGSFLEYATFIVPYFSTIQQTRGHDMSILILVLTGTSLPVHNVTNIHIL